MGRGFFYVLELDNSKRIAEFLTMPLIEHMLIAYTQNMRSS